MVENKGILVLITATTGVAASLYQGRRTLPSLLGIGVDNENSSNDGNSYRTSKFGSRSRLAEPLRKLALIIIYEPRMMEPKLFALVDVIFKDLRLVQAGIIVLRLV